MASSRLFCQGGEAMPSHYRAAHPTLQQQHGSYSRYSKINILTPPATVDVDGDVSFLRDQEQFPVLPKPVPAPLYDTRLYQTDPTLCVTPEKETSAKSIRSKKSSFPSAKRTLSDSRAVQSVRFDNNVDIKYMSPEKQDNSESVNSSDNMSFDDIVGPELEDTNCPITIKKDHNRNNTQKEIRYAKSTSSTSKSCIETSQNYSDKSLQKSKESDKTKSHQCNKFNKASSNHGASYTHLATSSLPDHNTSSHSKYSFGDYQGLPSLINDSENMLARPEFLSTLRVTKEMQELMNEELDVTAAVENKLKESVKAREKLTEKVTSRLNVSEDQFSDLVSLDVQEEDILSKKAEEIASRARPTHRPRHPRPEDRIPAPDLLEFFSDKMVNDVPCLTVNTLPDFNVPPSTMDPIRAFDLYKHIRSWEGAT